MHCYLTLVGSKALANTYLAGESSYMANRGNDASGTTAVMCLYDEESGKLFVANCGDSRAVVLRWIGKGSARRLKAIPLTHDHDASDKAEARRIKAAAGEVDEDGYVNGCVQVSRSIGDYAAKYRTDEEGRMSFSTAVSPLPDVMEHQLVSERDEYLILGSDGLFEGSGGEMEWIAEAAEAGLKEGRTPQQLVRQLTSTALKQGSTDNITGVVCRLT